MAQVLAMLIGLIALAGCSVGSVQEMKERGNLEHYTLQLPPKAAATCMVRNTDTFSFTPNSTIRDGQKPGAVEIVSTLNEHLAFTLLEPAGTGSKASIWLSPLLIGKSANLGRHMAAGC